MRKQAGKLKTALLAGAVAALVLCSSAGTSMAYFTTYVTAQGTQSLQLKMTIPGIKEEFEGTTKVVTASNNGEQECYVRVAWFAPMDCDAGGDGWREGTDGYWYYETPLQPGEAASVLRITPKIPDEVTEDFNIIVTVESAPVLYDEYGSAIPNGEAYQGWTMEGKEKVPVTTEP